ncbi:unnamed protein product, partial [Didymodactylos carnosus]
YKWLLFETQEKSTKAINHLKDCRIESNPPGRKPYYRTHPELLPELKKLLNTHSGEAQDRRRDDTVRFNGLSITDCNNYVKRRLSRRYPNIYKLSNSTIHRLFIPPKKNVRSQKFYKSIIPAKIPQKQNSKCQHHPDFIIYHDFPKAGVKITPAGYVRLWHHRRSSSANSNSISASLLRMKRSKSCESTLFKLNGEIKQVADKRNLKHVQWSKSGKIFLRPFGSTSEKATSQVHINNLQQIAIENNWFLHRSVLTIISDNGTDWKTECMANIYNFGRFWEENKPDVLIWVSYAPGNSRYNPIERIFSHLTDLIAKVTIDLDPTFSTINHQLDSALVDLNKY